MLIAVNDISFLKGFDTPYTARNALKQFAGVGLGLKDERVSKITMENNIVNSSNVNKMTMIAPGYTLIRHCMILKKQIWNYFYLLYRCLRNVMRN